MVRAGYGLYYNHDIANARFDVARNLAGRGHQYFGRRHSGRGDHQLGQRGGLHRGRPAPLPRFRHRTPTPTQYAHRTSYSEVFLFDVQKQLGKDWVFEAGYMGNVSRHLYGFQNANYSIPYGYLATGVHFHQRSYALPELRRDQLVHDSGIGNYNSFAFQVNKRFNNGIQSHQLLHLFEIDGRHQRYPHPVIGALSAGRPMHQLRIRAIGLRCETSRRGLGRLLPSRGGGRMWAPSSKIVDAVIGGWELATLIQLQTGVPWNPGINANTANTNTISGGTPATRRIWSPNNLKSPTPQLDKRANTTIPRPSQNRPQVSWGTSAAT